MVGASTTIFIKKVRYSNNICLIGLTMDIQLVFVFHKILLPLVSMISASFVHCKCLLRLWLKKIQRLQKTFNVKHQRKVWKGLYRQICPMNHTMHTHDKCNKSILDLNCNSIFEPWKILTPWTPKQNGFETNSFSFKPFYVIKKFMIKKVKLLTPDPKTTCCTFNNKVMWHQSCTM